MHSRILPYGRHLLTLVPLAAAVACSEITTLEQSNPSQLEARSLFAPENTQLLVNGAIADFECAFHRYVVAGGLVADELINVGATLAIWDYDRRTTTPGGAHGTAGCGGAVTPGVYTPLSVARASADRLLGLLQNSWTDQQVSNRTRLIGQTAAYSGYSLLLLGEAMCSAAIDVGPELTRAQIWAQAQTRLEAAIAAATTSNDQQTLNFARVGLGRTLLNLGQTANAALAVANVPASFTITATVTPGASRRENMVYRLAREVNLVSVDPSFRGLNDPRVQVNAAGKPTRDTSTTPITIASGDEAQLIIAEARVVAGDLNGAATIINTLRAAVGLPPYDATGQTADQVLRQVILERGRELFLQGHRLGDMIRYGVAYLPLVPAAGTPFPTGGGQYGTQLCFPLPDIERNNNPNIPTT